MKKTLVLVLAALLVSLMFTGCMTSYTATNGKLAYATVSGAEKGNFTAKAGTMAILSRYLVPINKPYETLEKVIDPELSKLGANAAKNVVIKDGFDFVEYLITSLTGGLLSIGHVEVTGMAVAQ